MKLSHLQDLARLYNIQLTYEDAAGKRRSASKEALVDVLRARLGRRDLDEALRERTQQVSTRFIEPVTVVWGRNPLRVNLRFPAARANEKLDWHLQLENGEEASGRVELSATISIPAHVPFGYHLLRIGEAETFVIASPLRAFEPPQRSWGVFAPLYAIHNDRNRGAGDLGDLRAYRQWVDELGGGIVATLPLLAIDAESDPSPYSPLSRLFWNELYLELERVPEFDPADGGHAAQSDRVDYAAVTREKRRLLEKMLTRFRPDAAYEEFAKKARHYADFRAHLECGGYAAALDAGNRAAASPPHSRSDYHLYVQYRMSQQMREVADEADLYLDFPLGVNPNGYDAKHYAESFAKGVSVGSPPDAFFTKGQNWGFPPFDPDAIREQRYSYFRDCVRHHASHAGVLRMDHVMGLHRLFWIVEGGEAKDGVYVRYAEEELYAILVLESNRNRCALVGEDLGTVPQYVPAMMKKHGLRRMYVVQYEAKPEGDEPIGRPAKESVASINTHDMPTFASFWSGRDVDDRLEMELLDERGAKKERENREHLRGTVQAFLKARGLLEKGADDTKAVLEALLRFLAQSDPEIVLVNLEDLWLETEPQNVPAVPERSWRQKFRYTLEQLQNNSDVTATLRSITGQRREVDGNAT